MQPLMLTLTGFRGIRDGMGLETLTLDFERLADGAALIAITGVNGRGKTTVLDNAHPYLALPARAASNGLGGFSFYDHVYLPESIKDLTWAHEGRSYRSQVVIRLNGRRRTEAFLHEVDDSGRWRPVTLADGSVSDGRAETYTRCVEALCGSADTFFTSMFSAQGRRPLSGYRNPEIKALLAELLELSEIQALGQRAGETVRLLKSTLMTVRQDIVVLDAEAERLDRDRGRVADAGARMALASAARDRAREALEAVRAAHARCMAQQEMAQATETRRAQLAAERQEVLLTQSKTASGLARQEQAEIQRLERLGRRIDERRRQALSRREALAQSRHSCLEMLADVEVIQRAVKRLPLAETVASTRRDLTGARRRQVEQLRQCEEAERQLEQRVLALEQEAGRAALKAEALAHRMGLTREVPCAGTDLQGRCKLLGDAREAQTLIPNAGAEISRLASEKTQAQHALSSARARRLDLASAVPALAQAERQEARARQRVGRLNVLAARLEACAHARQSLTAIDAELSLLGAVDGMPEPAESEDEAAERQQILEARRAIGTQRDQLDRQSHEALERVDVALAALPAPCDDRRLEASARTASAARQTLAAMEQAHLDAVRDAQILEELLKQQQAMIGRRAAAETRKQRVEAALGDWNLFARCMSNDGLIALSIDDAGPALAALANDLLLACYGPRFTVAIHTLLETGKGEQKEGFDIVVHDAETGQSKSVGLMSGGERTWVEASLTRAIALYLAQNTGRRYTTLFSDEADGALDPERKRMFMAMKREVLRLGGYEREFFVSQTAELTAMADAVIDLDALAVSGSKGPETVARDADTTGKSFTLAA